MGNLGLFRINYRRIVKVLFSYRDRLARLVLLHKLRLCVPVKQVWNTHTRARACVCVCVSAPIKLRPDKTISERGGCV